MSVLVKKFLNALLMPGMAFKALWQAIESWLIGLKKCCVFVLTSKH